MLGNFFAGFEKRAEEKKKRSAAATGAMAGGGLGALPGAALWASSRNSGNNVPWQVIAGLLAGGSLIGAGAGGLAGGAVDLARKHRKKD